MSNELSRVNRVRYTLYGNPFVSLVISEPEGWNDDEKELIRSDKWFGIFTNLSSNLKYYGNAFVALKSAYDIYGIKASVRMEKEERNSNTDDWQISYVGYLDFSTYSQEKNYISLKFNESQFFKNIESRLKEKYELDRITNIKNNGPLEPFVYSNLNFIGRDIFRQTLFNNEPVVVRIQKTGNPIDADAMCFPMTLKYRSDPSFFAPSVSIDSADNLDISTAKITVGFGNYIYNGGNVYYLRAEKDKTINVDIKIKIRAKFNTPSNPASASFSIGHDIIREDGSGDMVSIDTETLLEVNSIFTGSSSIIENVWKEFEVTLNQDFDLLEGDSMGLRLNAGFGLPGPVFANVWNFELTEIIVKAEEIDIATATNCQVTTYFEALERLFQIITGKNTFQSNLLSNEWKDLLLTNGFKLRQFPDKPIITSLEELLDSLIAIDDIALIIENETVRVEKKDYVYTGQVGIVLSQVSNVKRKISEKLHFNSIEIGYDFNGEYEEAVGLDEYNIKNTYTTCIDTTESTYKSISKVRADGYGMSFAQKKEYENFPKEDTKYDKYNFMIDAIKVSNGVYAMRYWEEDFDNAPTGVFSPATAFNLRLSPFNCLLRKSKYLSTGLQKYPLELLQYSSTEGNSQLVTLYPERAVVLNEILSSPYFLPEEIDFDKKINMMDFKQVVKYPYKLINFVNEFGEEESAYIISVKPNKEGKFKLIKVNL